jgi:transcriptional regulator with XRE-family HTH domain
MSIFGKIVNIFDQKGGAMYGQRVAAERKRLGLTQRELAALLGVGRTAVAMIETGKASLDINRLVELGASGFDILFVLTGMPGRQAAGKLLNWELCLSIAKHVQKWTDQRGTQLPSMSEAMLVKNIYMQVADQGILDPQVLADTLQIAA